MELSRVKKVYFLGIGGIGMSALARFFRWMGASVSGYDKTPTVLTGELQKEGIPVHFDEDPAQIPADADLIIRTPAIPADHKELVWLNERNTRVYKRAEILGMISDSFLPVAVAGTHGKTTTTALLAHIFFMAERKFMAFLGGISKNYQTNFIHSIREISDDNPLYCIAEADEYDRSFLFLHPNIAVITSADPDHLDIYGDPGALTATFEAFTGQIRNGGALVMKYGLRLSPQHRDNYTVFPYSVTGNGDFFATRIRVENGTNLFDLVTPFGTIGDIHLALPGTFNIENAVAASAAAMIAGIGKETIKYALESYEGVMRRFDYQVKRPGFIYIDDYAHHPEELRACISSVRALYPEQKVTGVFQPHLFSRTRDFADDFARSLEMLDDVILLDIYPAREKPIEGVTSKMLLDKIRKENKILVAKEGLLNELVKRQPEILLTLGAGDIDQFVEPIKRAFELSHE